MVGQRVERQIERRPIGFGVAGVELGFQVDQQRVLAGSDDVAQVEVGGLQGVEQGQVGPLPPVEALNFGSRRHGRGLGPGHPAIRSAVKQWRRRQGGFQAAVVQPDHKLMEAGLDGQRAGLVDEPRAGGER